MRVFRHGDVVIAEVTDAQFQKVAAGQKLTETTEATLALGEITGHSHVLEAKKLLIADFDNRWERRDQRNILQDLLPGAVRGQGWRVDTKGTKLLDLQEAGTLTHNEHKKIDLPAGKYVVYQQREHWEDAPEGRPRRVYD